MIICEDFDLNTEASELLGSEWRLWPDAKAGIVRIGVGGAGRSHWVFGEGVTEVEALRMARDKMAGRKWFDMPTDEVYKCP